MVLDILRITFDPSIRYTVWSIILGGGLNATAFYACLQTQAQRYLCVKNIRSAQKYFLFHKDRGNLFDSS